MFVRKLASSLVSLFYPRLCAICNDPLVEQEEFLCFDCLCHLPKTNYHRSNDNAAKECFAGKIPVAKATSWLYYNKGGMGQTLIEEIKYHGNSLLGEWTGEKIANDIAETGWLDDIDLLIPVPLHSKKLKKRGYNQAETIAAGIAKVSQKPMNTSNIRRTRANPTQTTKGLFERWENTLNLFETVDTSLFQNKHLLIIDDVLTSGSTIEAVGRAALKTKNVKISVLTVGIA